MCVVMSVSTAPASKTHRPFRTEHSATASAIAISATGLNRSKFGSDVADPEGASLVPTFGNLIQIARRP
jgi:hypothetical protein